MTRTGWNLGDTLIARYEYGLVHLRRLPPGQDKVVTSRVSGQWLLDLGFEHEAVLTVDSEPGQIVCQLQEDGIKRTAELVKYARLNGMNLLQVHKVHDSRVTIPLIEIPPSRFVKAGFAPDDACIATYEHGRITLQPIDFAALGF